MEKIRYLIIITRCHIEFWIKSIVNLTNAEHPYRQKIDVDFGGKVEVYTKEQLLNGQNFNPVSVDENLSIFVLTYDSFRTNKKEGRKAYQQNGNLTAFNGFKGDTGMLLEDVDDTALIQVIRQLNPVAIVDDERVIIRTKLEKPSKIKGLALI